MELNDTTLDKKIEYSRDCDIVVIVPVYKQPGLLIESLSSVLAQKISTTLKVVIVNDGCPFAETKAVAAAFSRSRSDLFHYIYKSNGGLSSARNAGIDYAIDAFPKFKAAYFLDADNRLGPLLLDRLWSALIDSENEVGWSFPDIDMFGFHENYSVSGRYSELHLLHENYCEAGSMVKRTMIDAGVRFDETMRRGFEDWDFWLQGAGKGFRGLYVPFADFRYRRRAESMLRDSERDRPHILDHIRKKHANLFNSRYIATIEDQESPRFALFQDKSPDVELFVDPNVSEKRRSRDIFIDEFIQPLVAPKQFFFPPACLFSSAKIWNKLKEWKIDRGMLWMSRMLLREAHLVFLVVKTHEEQSIFLEPSNSSPTQKMLQHCPFIIAATDILREAARDPDASWLASAISDKPQPIVRMIDLTIPVSCLEEFGGSDDVNEIGNLLLGFVSRVRSALAELTWQKTEWRTEARADKNLVRASLAAAMSLGETFPHIKPLASRSLGFVLPLFMFGGVEKVILNYARAFKTLGYSTHLFITGDSGIPYAPILFDVFDSIVFFNLGDVERGDWDHLFSGVGLSDFSQRGDIRDAVGLLSTMDVVVNTHATGAHGLMAALRKLGIVTFVGLHLIEKSRLGQPIGNAHAALAYEHAYDGFVVISRELVTWCKAYGVPDDKIIMVPNAASYDSSRDKTDVLLLRRDRNVGRGSGLNLLYLGRLDFQKGVDRLEQIMRETQGHGDSWKVVGRAVLDKSTDPLTDPLYRLEKPVNLPEELDDLYSWADVLVLPSRFEGVPLTIIEAQRLGCVPLAADVGAVREVIDHGQSGILVDVGGTDFEIVERFSQAIQDLRNKPEVLDVMSRNAIELSDGRAWSRSIGELHRRIEQRLS